MKSIVYVRFTFEGFHCWPDAPNAVEFLQHRHRHLFHVRVAWETNVDRQVEFFLAAKAVQAKVRDLQHRADTSDWSCERWAQELLTATAALFVEVSEDGENGAIVWCP